MNEVKKLWIKVPYSSGFPFWESEITDDEHLKSGYEDFDSSLCVVPLSALEAEKAKVEKLKSALNRACYSLDCRINGTGEKILKESLKEIEASDCQKITG